MALTAAVTGRDKPVVVGLQHIHTQQPPWFGLKLEDCRMSHKLSALNLQVLAMLRSLLLIVSKNISCKKIPSSLVSTPFSKSTFVRQSHTTKCNSQGTAQNFSTTTTLPPPRHIK